MEELTIKEALEQGYTNYLFTNDEFQGLKDISDIDEHDLARNDIRLVENNPYSPDGVSSKEIAELLAEHIWGNHFEESNDDSDEVYDMINALDFTEAENKISKALAKTY